jgi:hypothetical protein
MEMETEDDVTMEGDIDVSPAGAATIVTDKHEPVNDNVETDVLSKEPATLE